MNAYIQLKELNFADGHVRDLVLSAHSIRNVVPWPVGTVVECFDGDRILVSENRDVIRRLILHAEKFMYARRADLPPDPDEELFQTSTKLLPGPVYARNTVRSLPEDLTTNEVDLQGLLEQHDRMLDRIGAEALDE